MKTRFEFERGDIQEVNTFFGTDFRVFAGDDFGQFYSCLTRTQAEQVSKELLIGNKYV